MRSQRARGWIKILHKVFSFAIYTNSALVLETRGTSCSKPLSLGIGSQLKANTSTPLGVTFPNLLYMSKATVFGTNLVLQ